MLSDVAKLSCFKFTMLLDTYYKKQNKQSKWNFFFQFYCLPAYLCGLVLKCFSNNSKYKRMSSGIQRRVLFYRCVEVKKYNFVLSNDKITAMTTVTCVTSYRGIAQQQCPTLNVTAASFISTLRKCLFSSLYYLNET